MYKKYLTVVLNPSALYYFNHDRLVSYILPPRLIEVTQNCTSPDLVC